MATGLVALLDDIASIAKVAAASLDDVAGQAAQAGAKSAGVVIDGAAVTPRYVVGFTADRELPIVARIAVGSLRNKLLFLLPIALLLSVFAPWGITPLLMLGGLYLSYEGTEKVFEAIFPHEAHEHEAKVGLRRVDPRTLEDRKVKSAIRTDFILSAEIMAIALATLPASGVVMQGVVLALVGIGITLLVYGAVGVIVKADDVGVAMAKSALAPPVGGLVRGAGRGLVKAMPTLLATLAVVGTAAMVWVGGGIIIHGLDQFGLHALEHVIHDLAEAAAHAAPVWPGLVGWLVTAACSGLVGLAVGGVMIPLVGKVIAPAWRAVRGGGETAGD